MESLYRDMNPYLVELGGLKRAASWDLSLVPARNPNATTQWMELEEMAPVVCEFHAIVDEQSQYESICSIVSMLRRLRFFTSKKVIAKIEVVQGGLQDLWLQSYTHELTYIRLLIDKYNRSHLDDVGKFFRAKLPQLQCMLLELIPEPGKLPHSDQLLALKNEIDAITGDKE